MHKPYKFTIVNNRMIHAVLQPQEIEVFYIIPSIRSSLAKHLKNEGKNQKTIAQLLGIQTSTVSHYLNNKRAAKITFTKDIEQALQQEATTIKKQTDVIKITQYILQLIRTSKAICDIHHQIANNVPKACDACYTETLLEVKTNGRTKKKV
ncbi:MAG: helix-turn-helix domain-containing protein [Nanoarchaeota archaeon]|nr:helix-turn-helix domain-containing protein [Nanoarchaeota archaeon]